MKNNNRWRLGLLWIIIVYLLYYILFYENSELEQIPRKIRHFIKFFTSLSVYLIGTLHLSLGRKSWMWKLWHMIHLTCLPILMLLGLWVWFVSDVSQEVKDFSLTIQELLISPTLYVVMGMLNRKYSSESI